MLQILTSILQGSRADYTVDAWTLASGVTGTFVEISGDSTAKPTAGNQAFPVWSESNRDDKGGFSPDIAATGKITVYYGKLKAITDQFVGTPAAGDKLYVDANGKLTTTSAGAAVVIATCTKAPHSAKYLSKTYSCIEYVLV